MTYYDIDYKDALAGWLLAMFGMSYVTFMAYVMGPFVLPMAGFVAVCAALVWAMERLRKML